MRLRRSEVPDGTMFAMNRHRRAAFGRVTRFCAIVAAVVLTQAGCATVIAGKALPAEAAAGQAGPRGLGRLPCQRR